MAAIYERSVGGNTFVKVAYSGNGVNDDLVQSNGWVKHPRNASTNGLTRFNGGPLNGTTLDQSLTQIKLGNHGVFKTILYAPSQKEVPSAFGTNQVKIKNLITDTNGSSRFKVNKGGFVELKSLAAFSIKTRWSLKTADQSNGDIFIDVPGGYISLGWDAVSGGFAGAGGGGGGGGGPYEGGRGAGGGGGGASGTAVRKSYTTLSFNSSTIVNNATPKLRASVTARTSTLDIRNSKYLTNLSSDRNSLTYYRHINRTGGGGAGGSGGANGENGSSGNIGSISKGLTCSFSLLYNSKSEEFLFLSLEGGTQGRGQEGKAGNPPGCVVCATRAGGVGGDATAETWESLSYTVDGFDYVNRFGYARDSFGTTFNSMTRYDSVDGSRGGNGVDSAAGAGGSGGSGGSPAINLGSGYGVGGKGGNGGRGALTKGAAGSNGGSGAGGGDPRFRATYYIYD